MDFYSTIAKYYNYIFPINNKQLSMVDSCIGENYEAAILDIGCGTGQLANSLARKYTRVVAGDTNNLMLDIAKADVTSDRVTFLNFGMLDIGTRFNNHEFDVVLCLGNTLVHLADLTEIELFIKQVSKVLKTGGKFIFQIINYDNVLENGITALPTIDNEKIRFIRNYKLRNDGSIDFSTTLTVKETGGVISNRVKLFPIRKNQIETLLIEAGFSSINYYSSFNRDIYKSNSLPLVVECY